MQAVVCWLLLAAIFIVAEIISLGLTTIWFAGGAFVAAIAGLAGANVVVQVVLFVVVSLALVVLTRPIAKKYLDVNTEKTNVEALVGMNAYVLEEINNVQGSGRAKVNGMEWTARSIEDSVVIPAGIQVKIVEVSGVKLILQAPEKYENDEIKEEMKDTKKETLNQEQSVSEEEVVEKKEALKKADIDDDIRVV